MTTEPSGKAPLGNRLWLVLVILLFALIVIWLLDPFGGSDDVQPGQVTPPVEVTTEPADAGVPVRLPETDVGEPASPTPGASTPAPAQ